jgi:hypothetical protein
MGFAHFNKYFRSGIGRLTLTDRFLLGIKCKSDFRIYRDRKKFRKNERINDYKMIVI